MAKEYENNLLEKIVERIKKIKWYNVKCSGGPYTSKSEILKIIAYIEGLNDGIRESRV